MRKIIFMTSAAVIAPMSAIAQTTTCTATPDCASLGYTETSCPNGGVKCPWGDAWACTTSESEICSKYGFKYSCTGTGYAGGEGGACGGKYTSCKCASGYNWVSGQCKAQAILGQCSGYAAQCALGDILFSDGTCSANTVSGKTPIAIVVYISKDGCGQAMALKLVSICEWGDYNTDIPTLPNYDTASAASKDYDSCGNTGKIIAAGDKNTYPAAWAAYEYSTEGTKAGEWCLPAAGIITSIYNNQDAINIGFSRAGGTQFADGWSSSEIDSGYAWDSYFVYDYGLNENNFKGNSGHVFPVIEFQFFIKIRYFKKEQLIAPFFTTLSLFLKMSVASKPNLCYIRFVKTS